MNQAMKSSVNLFKDDLRPVREKLSLENLAIAWVVVMVAMSAWALTLTTKHQVSSKQQKEIAAVVKKERAKRDELTTKANAQIKDPVLVRRLERAHKELSVKRQLMDKLIGGSQLGQTDGYSAALVALAEYHDSRISLSRILLVGDKVSLWGATSEGRAITQWLEGMAQSEYFNGSTFDMMKISKSPESDLTFAVESINPEESSIAPASALGESNEG